MSDKQITREELQVINQVLAQMADEHQQKAKAVVLSITGLIIVEIGCALVFLKLLGVL